MNSANFIKEEEKKDINEIAKILAKIEQLPREEKIAMQYYIKGMLEGIQKSTESATSIGE